MEDTNAYWAIVKKTEGDFEPLFTMKNKRKAYMALELLSALEDEYEVVRLPNL